MRMKHCLCCVSYYCYYTVLCSSAPRIQSVAIETSSNSIIAGDSVNLTCSVTVLPSNLLTEPTIVWSGPGIREDNVDILADDSDAILSFSPLRTSNGGTYICDVSLDILGVETNLTTTRMIDITVQSKSFFLIS